MSRNFAMLLTITFLLCATAVFGQTSGGNVATSGPYATWELYDAQNPPARNFEGCILGQQEELWLIPRKGAPFLLNYAGDSDLRSLVGAHVKLHARENVGAGRRKDSTNYRLAGKEGKRYVVQTETIIENEINVDRFTVLSESCPDGWGQAKDQTP